MADSPGTPDLKGKDIPVLPELGPIEESVDSLLAYAAGIMQYGEEALQRLESMYQDLDPTAFQRVTTAPS